MTWQLEHPRAMVGLLLGTVLILAALLQLDTAVMDKALIAGVRAGMDYCLGVEPREF